MKIEIKGVSENPVSMLRRAGYAFQRNVEDEMSFVRPFGASGYPRFHMYVKVEGFNMTISIHYDAKKETYGEGKRHHGEYEDEGMLGEEVKRLKKILE
jgi:hypothetical protein